MDDYISNFEIWYKNKILVLESRSFRAKKRESLKCKFDTKIGQSAIGYNKDYLISHRPG